MLLLGVLSAAAAFSMPVAQAPPTGRVVAGTAVDARPVRRASVTLSGPSLRAPQIAETDTTGAFRFDRLPSGAVKVRIEKPGFVTLDADLTPNATFTLTRGGAVEGVVTDVAGEPVWNVVVTALRIVNGKPEAIARTRTDDLGQYRVHSLPAADYFVEVATDRLFITSQPLMAGEKFPEVNKGYYPAAAAFEDAKPVMVTAGRDSSGVDVTFTPSLPVKDPSAPPPSARIDRDGTGRIAGIVTDATTGKPVRAAQLLLLPAAGQGPSITDARRTDAQGRFEYRSLPSQRYVISVRAPRYVTLDYGQKRPGENGGEIMVHENEDVRADLKMTRTSAIEGSIVDEFGDPAPSVLVQLAQKQFVVGRNRLVPAPMRSQPPTDDRGRYRISGMPPGDYFVTALSGVYTDLNGAGGFAPTYYPGTIDASSATPVTIPFGADLTAATFPLVPAKTFSVSGTMIDADGRPVSGRGTVWLMTPDRLGLMDFNIARGATAPDGSFVLRNVPQGQYTLQGFAPASPGDRGGNLGAMPFGWLPIGVGDTNLDGLLLKTTPGTMLRGKFVLEDDSVAPPKPDQIWVNPLNVEFDSAPVGGGPSPSVTHDDLTFEATHQSGRRRIFVEVRTREWALKSITLNGRDITDTTVDLREHDVDGVEVLLTPKVSHVTGGVTDDKGAAVTAYAVVIFSTYPTKWTDRSRFVVMGRSTQEGRFTVNGLPPEDYLAVALPGFQPLEIYDPDFLAQLRPMATSFTLNEGETKTLELKLKRRP
jgi:hypothetical protein